MCTCSHTLLLAIDACAKSNTSDPVIQMNALKIAFAILKSIEIEGMTPDHYTFTNLMKCPSYLLPNRTQEQRDIAIRLFQKTKGKGLAGFNVLRIFYHLVDPNTRRELLGPTLDSNGKIDPNKIPPTWTKNIVLPR